MDSGGAQPRCEYCRAQGGPDRRPRHVHDRDTGGYTSRPGDAHPGYADETGQRRGPLCRAPTNGTGSVLPMWCCAIPADHRPVHQALLGVSHQPVGWHCPAVITGGVPRERNRHHLSSRGRVARHDTPVSNWLMSTRSSHPLASNLRERSNLLAADRAMDRPFQSSAPIHDHKMVVEAKMLHSHSRQVRRGYPKEH